MYVIMTNMLPGQAKTPHSAYADEAAAKEVAAEIAPLYHEVTIKPVP